MSEVKRTNECSWKGRKAYLMNYTVTQSLLIFFRDNDAAIIVFDILGSIGFFVF